MVDYRAHTTWKDERFAIDANDRLDTLVADARLALAAVDGRALPVETAELLAQVLRAEEIIWEAVESACAVIDADSTWDCTLNSWINEGYEDDERWRVDDTEDDLQQAQERASQATESALVLVAQLERSIDLVKRRLVEPIPSVSYTASKPTRVSLGILRCASVLLPRAFRHEYVCIWRGELATLPPRRRMRFTVSQVIYMPRLSWVLYRPLRRRVKA